VEKKSAAGERILRFLLAAAGVGAGAQRFLGHFFRRDKEVAFVVRSDKRTN
jgi:hypothetical protein